VYFTEATNIGSVCSIQEQCEVINGWCRGALGRESCICKPNSAPNPEQNYCLPSNMQLFSALATSANFFQLKCANNFTTYIYSNNLANLEAYIIIFLAVIEQFF
jgi:hypothetical protein